MMPFWVSGGGGDHEMKRDVELSDTTVTFSGELDGAEMKDRGIISSDFKQQLYWFELVIFRNKASCQ